jgi:hypothetical protein
VIANFDADVHMPDVILTGLPRSGSTLTCHLLNRCADTVALHEPMPMPELARQHTAAELVDCIAQFFTDTRRSLLEERRAVSKSVGGAVPDNTFGDARGGRDNLRYSLASHGEVSFAGKELRPDFTLAVKHNAGFTALLDRLSTRFVCYGIVRHPLAVLASWNSVKLPVQQGHVPAGEEIDAGLRQALERIADREERQLFVLAWFFERLARYLPRAAILRYEDLVASGGRILMPITAAAATLHEPLASRNANAAYDRGQMAALGEKLLSRDGAYWDFYSRASVPEMLTALAPAVANGC